MASTTGDNEFQEEKVNEFPEEKANESTEEKVNESTEGNDKKRQKQDTEVAIEI